MGITPTYLAFDSFKLFDFPARATQCSHGGPAHLPQTYPGHDKAAGGALGQTVPGLRIDGGALGDDLLT